MLRGNRGVGFRLLTAALREEGVYGSRDSFLSPALLDTRVLPTRVPRNAGSNGSFVLSSDGLDGTLKLLR